jgi:hypothetical protein
MADLESATEWEVRLSHFRYEGSFAREGVFWRYQIFHEDHVVFEDHVVYESRGDALDAAKKVVRSRKREIEELAKREAQAEMDIQLPDVVKL